MREEGGPPGAEGVRPEAGVRDLSCADQRMRKVKFLDARRNSWSFAREILVEVARLQHGGVLVFGLKFLRSCLSKQKKILFLQTARVAVTSARRPVTRGKMRRRD